MTRLSTTCALPNSNWLVFTTPTSTAWGSTEDQAFGKKPGVPDLFMLCQRAIIRAPVSNVGTFKLFLNADDPAVTLANGDEYVIAGQPGTTFDLAKWSYSASDVNADVLAVVYQP